MPYLHLDLPGTYPVEVKRELATRLCKLYADVMETQLWRPNVGIAELGEQIFTAWVQTASSPSPWSWSSFVATARRKSGWRSVSLVAISLPVPLQSGGQVFRSKPLACLWRCHACNSATRNPEWLRARRERPRGRRAAEHR